MARRREHSQEEIKTMILDAAEQVVITQGFSALKARHIAKEIGYTVGSLYMVYSNMADLVMHIHARTFDEIAVQLQKTPLSAAETTMESLALVYMNYCAQNFKRWRYIFDDRLLAGAVIPNWYQRKINQVYAPFELQLTQLKPELDALEINTTALAFFAGVHGICAISLSPTSDKDNIKQVETTVLILVKHFMRGWLTK